nr:hypothetical protein BaRGS_026054 [Batillaria attramentaria]
MVDALYDSSVNFTCDPAGLNMTTLEPGQVTRIWLLPTAEVLTAGTTGHARVDVLNDGRVLHVRSVNDEDFGVYYCVVRVFTGEYLAVRHGINVNGAYWGDLFKQYYDNLITGLVAAAVCFVAEGNAANFTCEETAPATAPHVSYRFWLLPSGKLLYPTSQGTELVKVLDRGQVLTVSDVSDARNFGTYYCLVYDAAQYEFRVGSKHVIDASPLYYTFFKQDSRIFGKMMGGEKRRVDRGVPEGAAAGEGRVLHVADVTDERYFGTYYCFTFIPAALQPHLGKARLAARTHRHADFFRMNANKIMLAYKDTMTQKPKPKVMTEGTAPAAPAVSAIPAAVAIPSVKRAVGDKVLTPVIANTQCPQQIPEGKVAVTVVVGGGDTAA